MIALLVGYTYSGTLPGIDEDISIITDWCKKRKLKVYTSSDSKAILNLQENKFDFNTMFLDMKDIIYGKKVFFFFSGHGKGGRFKTPTSEIMMSSVIKGLSEIADEAVIMLDCCEVSIDVLPSNTIIISASNSDSKSNASITGSLFVSDCLSLLRSRDCRDLEDLESKLRKKHNFSSIASITKVMYGWVVPGTTIDYDPNTDRISYTKDGKVYLLQ
jgi:hypothetical protein